MSYIESLKPHEALVFLHIMKTGGTTLFKLLKRNYPEHLTFHYSGQKAGRTLADFNGLCPQKRDQFKFIHGHLYFGFHEHLKQPCRYITMLRKPVNRVVSLYYFIHQNPNRYLPESSRCTTLRDYLNSRCLTLDNDQTRRIAGSISSHYDFGECDADLFETAKHNLRNFLAVGITERFDESLIVFKHALGMQKTLYSRFNENSRRPKLDDVNPQDLELIRHYNQWDELLYQYANELLDEKIQHMGDRFQAEYIFFKSANAQYDEVQVALSRTKAKLQRTRKKIKAARQNRRQLQHAINHATSSIESMNNSKFWRIWRGLRACLKR